MIIIEIDQKKPTQPVKYHLIIIAINHWSFATKIIDLGEASMFLFQEL